jgi:hypothetical protein
MSGRWAAIGALVAANHKLLLKPDGTINDASADAIDERMEAMGFGERVDRKHDIRTDNTLRMLPAPIGYFTTTVQIMPMELEVKP